MRHEILTRDEDLLAYSQKTRGLIDVALPLEYLKRSRVIVYKAKSGQILAGYCLAMNPPFRSLIPVPEGVRQEVSRSLSSVMEVNGLWIDPKYRSGIFAVHFWAIFIIELFKSGKYHYLYSFSAHKTRLAKFYAMGNPKRIWSGDVYIEGMDRPDQEIVEVADRRNLLKFMFKNVYIKTIRFYSHQGLRPPLQIYHSKETGHLDG